MSTGSLPAPTASPTICSTVGRRRSRRGSVAAVLTVAALVLAGCGDTGGDEADGTTTTTEADGGPATTGDDTTTTGGDDETTTTEGGDEGGEVSAEDLESVMPDESDIGPDYSSNSDVEEGEDEPSDSDDEIQQACPEAAQFMDESDDGEDDRVARLFETDDNREIEIKLDPTPNANFDEDMLDTVIDAVNACDQIVVEQNGITMTMELAAERDDTYGDRGVTMQMTALLEHADFPAPVTLEFSNRAFVVGSVSVSLAATDGLTGATAAEVEVVPGDVDLLTDLAERLESDVAALQE